MAKSKRLTLTPELIEEQDAQYDKLKKVTFEDGAWTEVYPLFKPSKIEECVLDLANFLVDYEKHGGKLDDDKEFFKFLYLYIVQHFSTVAPELPSDFATRLDLLNKLANNQYVIALEDHFDQKQIEKIYEMIFKKFDAMQKMVNQNQDIRKQLLEKIDTMDLKNKDIIKEVMFGEGVDTLGNNESETVGSST